MFRRRYFDFHVNEPLGPVDQQLPFHVKRTHRNNIPVYTEYRQGGNVRSTLIRCITGDVNEFKQELAKVVSNT